MWLTKFNELRKASGMSLDTLSERSGVPKGTLAKITSGATKTPALETVKSLVYAMGYSLADLDETPTNNKKAPSLSDEAIKVAKDYSVLDGYGKQAVRELIGTEKKRCEETEHFFNRVQETHTPTFINLYSEPAAAGIATPTMGKDYVSYELKPGDPKGAAFAVRVQGNSMEPEFYDGDIAFVNHDALTDGDIGVFCVDGGTVIKQYHETLIGTYLFSLNRKRDDADVFISIDSNQTVVCQGRVITPRRYPVPENGSTY